MSIGISLRDANIRSNDFVAGYALRVAWTNIEPAPGQFDFTNLDWNLRRLTNAGKTLSLLFMNTDPPWLAATTDVVASKGNGGLLSRRQSSCWRCGRIAREPALNPGTETRSLWAADHTDQLRSTG